MFLFYNVGFLIGSLIVLSVLFIILRLYRVSFAKVIVGALGLFFGLLISALLNIYIVALPNPWDQLLAWSVLLLFGFGGLYLFLVNEKSINRIFLSLENLFTALAHFSEAEKNKNRPKDIIVIDTSVIIDGRIEDVVKTGFLNEKFLVTKAVIDELHHLSDSRDSLKRERGRRGLDILSKLQKSKEIEIEIIEDEFKDTKEVDEKLIKIAKKCNAPVMTVDYNLNKVAKIQKVKVLNINELANAMRMSVLPGEELEVKVVQEGKERSQGVGFLPDGTMIVIEDAKNKIGETLKVSIVKSFQTEAGRMIFAEIKNGQKT